MAQARPSALPASRDGSNPRKAGQASLAKVRTLLPDDNGANPNPPSAPRFAPQSAQETRIPLYTPDGVFQTYMKNDWWQATPEMKAKQEESKRVQRDKMLRGIPTTSHTKHQVEYGYPDKCGCKFCRLNDPFYGQANDPEKCGCKFDRNMEKRDQSLSTDVLRS